MAAFEALGCLVTDKDRGTLLYCGSTVLFRAVPTTWFLSSPSTQGFNLSRVSPSVKCLVQALTFQVLSCLLSFHSHHHAVRSKCFTGSVCVCGLSRLLACRHRATAPRLTARQATLRLAAAHLTEQNGILSRLKPCETGVHVHVAHHGGQALCWALIRSVAIGGSLKRFKDGGCAAGDATMYQQPLAPDD